MESKAMPQNAWTVLCRQLEDLFKLNKITGGERNEILRLARRKDEALLLEFLSDLAVTGKISVEDRDSFISSARLSKQSR